MPRRLLDNGAGKGVGLDAEGSWDRGTPSTEFGLPGDQIVSSDAAHVARVASSAFFVVLLTAVVLAGV